jgi:predicted peroxiredoxin
VVSRLVSPVMTDKVLINLSTGLEDSERVMIAFLVAGAALEQGKEVAVFLTKEAVRLAVDGTAVGVACDGCPPLADLVKRYEAAGGRYYVCPICFNARQLDPERLISGAEVQGTIPMWQWIGDDGATTFSY